MRGSKQRKRRDFQRLRWRVGLGVSGYYLADALVRGDKTAALQASGGVLVSGAVLGDTGACHLPEEAVASLGALGHTVIPVVVVTEGAECRRNIGRKTNWTANNM